MPEMYDTTVDKEKIELLCNGFLEKAQVLFGPIQSGWSFVGVEFGLGPHLVYLPESKEVLISLSNRVLTDDVQLWFQLSHEICHLLHPSRDAESGGLDHTTVLNEGISTFFSYLMTSKVAKQSDVIEGIQATPYFDAFTLTAELVRADPDSIKRLRKIQPKIDRLTMEHFATARVEFPIEKVEALLERFDKSTN